MRRGRKVDIDGRVAFIRQSFITRPCLLVSIVLYPDCIKVSLSGGKRDPKLTTLENVERGGESAEDACVREVFEETGLIFSTDRLQYISEQQPDRSSTVFYSIICK